MTILQNSCYNNYVVLEDAELSRLVSIKEEGMGIYLVLLLPISLLISLGIGIFMRRDLQSRHNEEAGN